MHDVTSVSLGAAAYSQAPPPESESPKENPPVSSKQDTQAQAPMGQAKKYGRIKILLGIAGTVLFFAASLFAVTSGLSLRIEAFVRGISSNDYVVLLLYAATLGILEIVLTFPLSYYSGYRLEHSYKLSNQTLRRWLWEGTKGLLVTIPISTPILLAFYYCLKHFGGMWWLAVGSILFLVSVVLARVAPVIIFPLFYKFKTLEDARLKQRILALCETAGVKVEGIYIFDMSKNTKKANAAFTGIGKSKRIILGDTLVANFTDDEIETVFAHELGHYRLKHLWVMMAAGTISSFLGLYVTAQLYSASLTWFGFTSVDQIAALPLLAVWLGVYSLVTSPLSNMLSRSHEHAADRFALATTRGRQAFINAMKKLAVMNLSDPAPHPLVEFLFYSHPSVEKRIRAAEEFAFDVAVA